MRSQKRQYQQAPTEFNNQLSFFDICTNHHKGNPFSRSANLRTHLGKNAVRQKILNYLESQGAYGATCDEIEIALELSHQCASARCAELKGEGFIIVNGGRKTRSGSRAGVLVSAEFI